MGEQLSACVIGSTDRGGYGHSIEGAFAGLPDVQIVAVSDEDVDGAKAVADRLGARRAYADYQQMLARETPDLVAIGPRWVDRRREMVIACAEAGVKGILCEKPFAASLEHADAMLAACAESGTRLQLAHQMRVTPQIIRAHQLIREGAIGQLVALRGRGKEDARGGGEDLIVLGVHVLNLMRWFGGDAQWAFAHVAVGGRDAAATDVREGTEPIGPICGDSVVAMWGQDPGILGSFETRRNQRQETVRMGLQVWGTEGVIDISAGGVRPVTLSRRSMLGPEAADWEQVTDAEWLAIPVEERTAHDNQVLARDLTAAIGEGREPICGGEDARAVTEMIVSAYASHIARARVELPLPGGPHPLLTW